MARTSAGIDEAGQFGGVVGIHHNAKAWPSVTSSMMRGFGKSLLLQNKAASVFGRSTGRPPPRRLHLIEIPRPQNGGAGGICVWRFMAKDQGAHIYIHLFG